MNSAEVREGTVSLQRTSRRLSGPLALGAVVLLTACDGGPDPVVPEQPVSPTCTVAFVADGDTLRCADGRWIRLLLIDAPEMAQAPWGEHARDWLLSLAPATTRLRLEYDLERRDPFGRELAYLHAVTPEGDSFMVNEALAEDGYAVALVIPPNGRHEQRIRNAVERARATGRGLWGSWGFACAPADFRAGRCT